MPFEWFYLKMVEDTQNRKTRYSINGLKKRIQNHILHMEFER